jgi:hypothetical protein
METEEPATVAAFAGAVRETEGFVMSGSYRVVAVSKENSAGRSYVLLSSSAGSGVV